MNPSKKTAALLLCVFFALAVLFSSALIIHEAGHDCAGEDCPICRAVVYHACVIPDATACCAQGIEFTLAGDHRWPEDYPEPGTDIIITGRLETYMEDGMRYLNLADSEMVLQQPPAAS